MTSLQNKQFCALDAGLELKSLDGSATDFLIP